MTDRDAFIRALQVNPDDATAKLVFANWLDEHGEHVFAEYLRLGVELSREDDPQDHEGWERFRELHESLEATEDGLSNMFGTLAELLDEELDDEEVVVVPPAVYTPPPPVYVPPPPPPLCTLRHHRR